MSRIDGHIRDRLLAPNFWHPANPYDRVEIRGRVVRFVEGEVAERAMNRLSKKYIGENRYPWPELGCCRTDAGCRAQLAPALEGY